ncbi:hypothetical protein [Pedobacter sp. Hv1]|uniref:hypothetical protein n=1 Tax=Pedobacter sp. Hv1 TaxID=1740090 RepID=UPI0006D8B142|nr:hypothetical protein [Pedobacter sp. Hv1]KQB99367.1 hypothetical protein AQF98_17495 [Pedobacter sp. Hv1]
MKSKIVCILGVLVPFSLVHFWHEDEDKFPTALSLSIIFALIYLICFFIGVFKKRVILILSLPVYIVSFILLFQLVNYQTDRNELNAEKLIKSLEQYKLKTGEYPDSLTELKPYYISNIPKVWFGMYSKEYGYSFNQKNESYSLSIQIGTQPYKIWESSMGVWQFFD